MKYRIINENILLSLLERDARLNKLEEAGVDNWVGYEIAYSSTDFEEIANKEIKMFQKYSDIYEDDLK